MLYKPKHDPHTAARQVQAKLDLLQAAMCKPCRSCYSKNKMGNDSRRDKESGVVILALFVLIIIGVVIAAFLFVMQKQRKADGKDTQINIQSTIHL